jgi:hypothetical protein
MSAKKENENEKNNEETFKALLTSLAKEANKLKDIRRPEINNPNIPENEVGSIRVLLFNILIIIQYYAANLRPLDRKRLNGIGPKTMGFLENSYDLAMENTEFLPKFLTEERFTRDYDYFKEIRELLDQTDQIREMLWSCTIQAADVAFTDGLDFYNSVKEAGRRRVDGAESVYRKLEPFFHRPRRVSGVLTKRQEKRDAIAIIDGKKDGEMILKNIKPKISGGTHEVIERKLSDSASIHETKDAEFKE